MVQDSIQGGFTMTRFHWLTWLNDFRSPTKRRRAGRSSVVQIENLEDRALLTANLPVAVNDTYSVHHDTTLTTNVSVLTNDTDLDGDSITQAVLQNNVTHGTLTLNNNGTFTYTPTAGFTGADTFTYFAKDVAHNEQSNAAATVTINVTANTAPVVNPVTISTTMNTAATGTLTGTDADNDPLTFSEGATAETNGTVVVNPNGTFTFTPTNGFTGTATFSYRANDGSVNSTDSTVTINVNAGQNTAPVVSAVALTTTMNTAKTGTLTAVDAENDPLTFSEGSTAATHGTVVINPNGSFTFTPTNGFTGTSTFSYKASDGSLTSSDATVTIIVNAAQNTAPVVSNITLSTPINAAKSGTLTAVDAENDPVTFSAGSTAATHGTVVINPNGTFTFTPTNGFTGAATFSFKASDGSLTSNDATVTINVGSAQNTAPTLVNGNGSTSINAPLNGSLVSLATDAEGDALSFAVDTQPDNGTVTVNSNGTFTFTPNSNFTGTTSFTFTASDGLLTSLPATFTVDVNETTQGDFDLDLADAVTISNNPHSPTPLDPNVSITNVATGTNFANAQATISFQSGADSKKDRLIVIKHDGSVDVKGKKVFVDGSQVATITSKHKKGVPLQISFNSGATQSNIEAVLRRVAIQTRPSAIGGERVVQFQVSADGTTATDSIAASV